MVKLSPIKMYSKVTLLFSKNYKWVKNCIATFFANLCRRTKNVAVVSFVCLFVCSAANFSVFFSLSQIQHNPSLPTPYLGLRKRGKGSSIFYFFVRWRPKPFFSFLSFRTIPNGPDTPRIGTWGRTHARNIKGMRAKIKTYSIFFLSFSMRYKALFLSFLFFSFFLSFSLHRQVSQLLAVRCYVNVTLDHYFGFWCKSTNKSTFNWKKVIHTKVVFRLNRGSIKWQFLKAKFRQGTFDRSGKIFTSAWSSSSSFASPWWPRVMPQR